jgi:septal ring factor EnvC (AmiA/AmiB activator)
MITQALVERDILVRRVKELEQQLAAFNDNRVAAYRIHAENQQQLREQLAAKDAENAQLRHVLIQTRAALRQIKRHADDVLPTGYAACVTKEALAAIDKELK